MARGDFNLSPNQKTPRNSVGSQGGLGFGSFSFRAGRRRRVCARAGKLFAGCGGDEARRVAGVFSVDLLNDGERQELRSSTGFHFQRDIRGWSLGGLTHRASSVTIIRHNEISPLPDMKFDFPSSFGNAEVFIRIPKARPHHCSRRRRPPSHWNSSGKTGQG